MFTQLLYQEIWLLIVIFFLVPFSLVCDNVRHPSPSIKPIRK
nr:MAG TPA: hypothetical protein [Bacteriophage sp.]